MSVFQLVTLGGLALTDQTGADVAIPRRRLAVLALLAGDNSRGMTRDKLTAYLWPDSTTEDARHSLEQLLYSLRRQLGAQVVVGTDPPRLNRDIVISDVAAFDDALARGDDAAAVAAYHGSFLDGFYLRDAEEFGRWVEDERARRAAAYAAALERLAARAADASDWPAAVAAHRSLLALDRLSARHALGLIRALAAAGDRPEALRVAAGYEALIGEELGLPLESSIADFVRSIRKGATGANGGIANGEGVDQERAAGPEPPAIGGLPPVRGGGAEVGQTPSSAVRARSRRVLGARLAVGVVAGSTVLWMAAAIRAPQAHSPVAERARVAVMPYENLTGDSTLNMIGVAAAEYTRTALARTGLVDVFYPAFDFWRADNAAPSRRISVDTVVRQTGATIVIRAVYYADRDSLRFAGEGVEAKTGRVLFAFDSVKIARTVQLEALEAIRQHITTGLATEVDPAMRPWAGYAGKPPIRFDAFQEFAEGMTDFVSGIVEPATSSRRPSLFVTARTHLERAFRLDSTYYVAALWLFWSRYNAGDQAGADSVVNALRPSRVSMSRYEQVLYDYNDALLHGTPEQRYQLDKELVTFAPASEFNFCLARDALESNHPREALDVLAKLNDSYSWTRFMPPPPGFKVRALVQLGEHRKAVDESRRAKRSTPDDLTAAYPEMDALAALGRVEEIQSVVDRFVGPVGGADARSANLFVYAGLRLYFADRSRPASVMFSRALSAYTNGQASGIAPDVILLGRARSLYYLERWEEARVAFERLAADAPGTSRNNRRALTYLGSLAARRGDWTEVARIRGLLNSSAVNPAIARYFEARVAAIRGDGETALRLLSNAVSAGAQADELLTEGDAAASMEPDFAPFRGSAVFRAALGRW